MRSTTLTQLIAVANPLSQRAAHFEEVGFALSSWRAVKGAEAHAAFSHHVETQPSAVGFAVGVPVLELVFALLLKSKSRAIGHGLGQFKAHGFDLGVKQAEINLG